ncbi:hypothetical protein BDV29DRAFT_176610 [Aspergillus leporis]|uniref:Uncharacterized protein n=1 Tax=Aspergillus leporis TaxID=41062 RepID=A0A5N5X018_9EURO|nr:hypothetical protein BDV29DRAFT_176610 [Aspergillus leporis]
MYSLIFTQLLFLYYAINLQLLLLDQRVQPHPTTSRHFWHFREEYYPSTFIVSHCL